MVWYATGTAMLPSRKGMHVYSGHTINALHADGYEEFWAFSVCFLGSGLQFNRIVVENTTYRGFVVAAWSQHVWYMSVSDYPTSRMPGRFLHACTDDI